MNNNTTALSKPKRILAVDYLKAVSIIFIVFSHINNYNGSFKLWTISFSPIVFFFARGLVFKHKTERFSDWGKFILDRLVTIIAPYFIWALIYAKFEIINVIKILYGSHESLSLAGSLTSLWFLPCMFAADIIIEIILCISDKLSEKNSRIIFIAASSAVLFVLCGFLPHPAKGFPFELDVAVQAAAWVGIGYTTMYFLNKNNSSEAPRKLNIFVLILIAVIGLALSLTAYLNVDMAGGYVMVAEARYGKYPIYILTAVGGTIFLTALSFAMSRIKNKYFIKLMQTIGMNTMVIFALHKFVIFTMQDLFGRFSTAIPDFAALFIIFITALTVSLIAAPIINLYLPLLSGKIKYKGIWREK